MRSFLKKASQARLTRLRAQPLLPLLPSQQTPHSQQNSFNSKLALLGLLGATAVTLETARRQEGEGYGLQSLDRIIRALGATSQRAECAASFTDKNLDEVMMKIQKGLDELHERVPSIPSVKITSGLRGVRYFIEFPIVGRNVNAYNLQNDVKEIMENGKKSSKYEVKLVGTDSYLNEENVAYLIDYRVNSEKVRGTKCSGSVYIRGIKGSEGWDSFKFILEKTNDFSEFDAQLVVKMYEKALSNLNTVPQGAVDTSNMSPAQKKFAQRQRSKQESSLQPIKGIPGLGGNSQQEAESNDNDPVAVLEKQGCSVFLPHTQKNALTWDYLAGYDTVKRNIEDTVLLALTHGDIYD
mmetsp:Transcript_13342/g.22676  ORF Transcript_13342/g.22676 Transcript_13342/m.22676 type:complete len:353 (+) Transcript_13342:39-1097(+)